MKKIIVFALLALLIVAFIGCCTSPNNTRRTFGNCVAKFAGPVKAALCPPSQAQVDQAATAAQFLGSLAGQDWTAEIALARQTFLDVAARICVGLDKLQAALDQLDDTVLIVQGHAMLQGATATIKVPDVSALRAAVKK